MHHQNRIFVDDVLHLAKEIVARYGLSSTPFGGSRLRTEAAMAKHAIRSPTGRHLAANMEEFTMICIRRQWITYSERLNGFAMTDTEFCVDWDRIHAEQIRAASRRDPSHPAGRSVAHREHQVMTQNNCRRVVLHKRRKKRTAEN